MSSPAGNTAEHGMSNGDTATNSETGKAGNAMADTKPQSDTPQPLASKERIERAQQTGDHSGLTVAEAVEAITPPWLRDKQ